MTTKFEVGDTIWWLDTRVNNKPRIRSNVVLETEWEKYYGRYKYVIDDNRWFIWSSNTVVAKSYEELISLLYPTKVGPFDYNQLVYVIRDVGDNDSCLQITKAYVKESSVSTLEYIVSCDVSEKMSSIFKANIKDIYSTFDLAKQAVETWLNKVNLKEFYVKSLEGY